MGGAIQTRINANLSVSDSTFVDNQAIGGAGGSGGVGGTGAAGGINSAVGTTNLAVTHSTFTDNQAIGGAGGTGANGGLGHAGALENVSGVLAGVATLSLTDSTLTNNLAIGGAAGAGGTGGIGSGGGLENIVLTGAFPAMATVNNCRIVGNQAVGGAGSPGGIARGAGLANILGAYLTVSGSTLADNQAISTLASFVKKSAIPWEMIRRSVFRKKSRSSIALSVSRMEKPMLAFYQSPIKKEQRVLNATVNHRREHGASAAGHRPPKRLAWFPGCPFAVTVSFECPNRGRW